MALRRRRRCAGWTGRMDACQMFNAYTVLSPPLPTHLSQPTTHTTVTPHPLLQSSDEESDDDDDEDEESEEEESDDDDEEEEEEEEDEKPAAKKVKGNDGAAKKAASSDVDVSAAQGSKTVFVKNLPWKADEV
jgi:hypothetical protein